MSTVKESLKYKWRAEFEDGHVIEQPEDDRYSKHDDKAEHNPSAFRDVTDYWKKSPLTRFSLHGNSADYSLELNTGRFNFNGTIFIMDEEANIKRKLIFFRNCNWDMIDGIPQDPYVVNYTLGYEFKNDKGKTVKKYLMIE